MPRNPNMQRRHFEFIAETIRTFEMHTIATGPDERRNLNGYELADIRQAIAKDFGRRLKLTNGQFDYNYFLEACKPKTCEPK